MKQFIPPLSFLVKKLWTAFAIVLVLVAVMLSLLRLSLPYLHEKKHLIENYVTEHYGVDARIGSIDAEWRGLGPAIVLYDTVLAQDNKSPVGFYVKETAIELDFWGSVTARKIKSQRFELSGLDLSVNISQMNTGNDYPIVNALETLFLDSLMQFSVVDSRVSIFSDYNRQAIEIQHLSWFNKDQRHQGTGRMRVQELANNSAYFILDLRSEEDQLNGTFYAKGEDLDLSPWINELVKTDKQLNESRGNFVYWATIEDSRFGSAQVDISDSIFSWDVGGEELLTAIRGGEIRAVPDGNGWTINVDNLAIQAGEESWISNWSGYVSDEGSISFNNRGSLKISPLIPFTPLILDQQSFAMVTAMSPTARVTELNGYLDAEGIRLNMNFSGLNWQQVGTIPGGDDFHGQFFWQHNKGKLSLESNASTLYTDNLLPQNIEFDAFSAEVNLAIEDQGFTLYSPEIELVSDLVTISQSLSYNSASNLLAINAEIDPVALNQVHLLLPIEYLGKNTRDYLVRAFTGGGITQTSHLIWHGALDQFPYADNNGVFQAQVAIDDAEFLFSTNWPALHDLDITLLFENNSLLMRSPESKLMDVALSDLTAVIPILGQGAVLDIEAKGQAEAQQVADLLSAGSLHASVGKLLQSNLILSGEVNTDLALHIPLNGQNTVAKGQVELAGNGMYNPNLDMQLDDLNGVIEFTNDKVTASRLQGMLLQQPVEISYSGQQLEQGYDSQLEITGDWQITHLLEHFGKDLEGYVTGRSGWQADLHLLSMVDDFEYQLDLETGLQGLTSKLPYPFYKLEDDNLPLTLFSEGNQQASSVSVLLGDQVEFKGLLPHKEMQFSRAHLAIGNSDFVGLGVGFSISAALDEVRFADWYKAVELLVSGLNEQGTGIFATPQRIFVEAGQMEIGGQRLDKVEMLAKQSGQDWLLQVNAEQARAEVLLANDWLGRGIEIDADFIRLDEIGEEQQQGQHEWQIDRFPPIRFDCANCWLMGKDLGKIHFQLSKHNGGMTVERLELENAYSKISAQGNWYANEQASSTRLTGNFNSKDFGNYLKLMGLDSGIKDSKANFDFDLSWQKGLFDVDLPSLNGQITWRLTDGYLTQVSDKGARIFSILSLDSLVRKLSLDFRDVFAQGFFYDSMKGSFQLVNGKVHTKDAEVDGAAGDIEIAGYTDLVNRNLNYTVSFTPNVTGNLPFLVYFMVNPPTALAALALDQVLTSAKVISNVNYSVTGTIDEPILTELGRDSEDIALPAKQTPEQPAMPDEPVIEPPQNQTRVSLEVNGG